MLFLLAGTFMSRGQNLPFDSGSTGADGAFRTNLTFGPARSASAIAFDAARGQMVLFGGATGSRTDETWLLQGTDWIKATPVTKPSPLSFHAMAYDAFRREIVLFGGAISGISSSTVGTNATWYGTESHGREKLPPQIHRVGMAHQWPLTLCIKRSSSSEELAQPELERAHPAAPGARPSGRFGIGTTMTKRLTCGLRSMKRRKRRAPTGLPSGAVPRGAQPEETMRFGVHLGLLMVYSQSFMKLNGLNALVTGGSQGLGKTIAEHYLREGANVVLCARGERELNATRDELAAKFATRKVLATACDVSNETQVNDLVVCALRALGSLDILVLNAGVYGPMGPTESVDLNEWRRAIDINLFGVLLPCRAVIPHFKRAGRGKIVVLSGGGATNPRPNISSYAASKAAVVRLMETLALELKDFQVDVNAIAPGALATRLVDEVLAAGPEKVGAIFYEQNKQWKEKGRPRLGPPLSCTRRARVEPTPSWPATPTLTGPPTKSNCRKRP